ncbi:MAG TPA: hypothetical protein VGQ07_03200, partial [Nitrospirales bacterium]|nr:hypothetical protein [Nitrospirales bacterium]
LRERSGLSILSHAMSWRRVEQGIETQTLEIQPATCPVCRKGLYRNVTFLTGGWARCTVCNEFVHYGCLSGGKFLKDRPRLCADCKAGRVRPSQRMPVPPPKPEEPVTDHPAATTVS